MASRSVTPSPLYLLVLATLAEGPMHPYEIQRLAIERDKSSIRGVKRGSVYHAVQRLERAGLIEAAETNREGRRPERTVYRLTEEGSEEVRTWMETMLRRPSGQLPELVHALEFLALLTPDEARGALEHRIFQLDRELGGQRATQASIGDRLPRVFMIEAELTTTLLEAERAWVAAVVEDLAAGAFTWSLPELHEWARHSALSGRISGVHAPDPADPGP